MQRQTNKNLHARHLFDGIAHRYDGPAEAFSLFQYWRWRRMLVSKLNLTPSASVLDVCTGPAGVASAIAKKAGCHAVGLDLSDSMMIQAKHNIQAWGLTPQISLVQGRAESLPFRDNCFDVVVFTFLLRYVEDPQSTIKELARVLRPGGQLASLEFYIPQGPLLHPLWLLHTRGVLPLGTKFLSRGWGEVGSFLGPSISNFYRKYSLEDLGQMWKRAGLGSPQHKVLSVGGAVVMWGHKENAHEG